MSKSQCELRTLMLVNMRNSTAESALSVRDLVVDYSDLRAVANVSFDAKPGSVTAV